MSLSTTLELTEELRREPSSRRSERHHIKEVATESVENSSILSPETFSFISSLCTYEQNSYETK